MNGEFENINQNSKEKKSCEPVQTTSLSSACTFRSKKLISKKLSKKGISRFTTNRLSEHRWVRSAVTKLLLGGSTLNAA